MNFIKLFKIIWEIFFITFGLFCFIFIVFSGVFLRFQLLGLMSCATHISELKFEYLYNQNK